MHTQSHSYRSHAKRRRPADTLSGNIVRAIGPILLLAAWMSSFTALADGMGTPDQGRQTIQARPIFGPLSASQISQIQTLGRSILAAKFNKQPPAEEQSLVAELHALSSDLDNATRPVANASRPLNLSPSSSPAAVIAPASASPSGADKNHALLQDRLTRLHVQGMTMSNAADKMAVMAKTDSERAGADRDRQLVRRASEIEQAVQTALELPAPQRMIGLLALDRQLKPMSLDEFLRSQKIAYAAAHPEETSLAQIDQTTPSITTLIQHRLGLDSAAVRKSSHSSTQ